MNAIDAAHAVVHEYQGGAESLAPRIPMSAAVLRNKVNSNNTTHHLTLAEAIRVSLLADDRRILEAFARELGCAVVPIPAVEACHDAAILEMMAHAWTTHGEVGQEISKTLEDGRVERHEVTRVEVRIFEHAKVLLGIAARLRGMAE